ncbi:Double homeobox protein A, partial [Heterocephalus glaber]
FLSNSYPGIDSRQQLGNELGIPESRVQIWFWNQRSRLHVQGKQYCCLSWQRSLGSSTWCCCNRRAECKSYGVMVASATAPLSYTGSFLSNSYPGIDSRQQLGNELGIPESRVQIWFWNQRSR